MAQQNNNSSKSSALGKDHVMYLLDLISSHKVITTKATNATNNKLKDDAWKSIAEEFSATTGVLRRPEQLRLKWENLKKAARKRNTFIRQNNLKTGGGKTVVLPDEALDRVASMLGATCTGFTVEFGGDKENIDDSIIGAVAVANIEDYEPLPEIIDTEKRDLASVVEGDNIVVVSGVAAGGSMSSTGGGSWPISTPKKFTFRSPNNSLNRKRKLSEEVQMAKRDKDLAIAAYFKAKAEKIQLENAKLKLDLDKTLSGV